MECLKPILLSGGGRTGSTQIMSLLGTDSRVVFDREFPFENRYLAYFAKVALLLQHPDLLKFFQPQQLFELNYLGFGGYMPGPDYVPDFSPHVYLPRADAGSWLQAMWHKFSSDVWQHIREAAFYAEKAPVWLAPMLRPLLESFTIYNFRDPRDVFLSTNALLNRKNSVGFGRLAGDSDQDHARRIAQAFLNTFDNYYVDRKRTDTLLVRYEDLIQEQAAVLQRISRLTGTELMSQNGFFNRGHATAADIGRSVERWTRERISPDVVLMLELLLHEEMTTLGYRVSLSDACRPARTVCFAEGKTRLSRIGHSSHGVLEQAEDYAIVQVRGQDFHMFLPLEEFEAAEVKEVWVSVSGGVGNICSLYWRRRNGSFDESSSMHVAHRPSPHWEMLTFPVCTHPEWRGTIKQLRLDLFNSHLRPNCGTGLIRWVRLVP